MIYSMTPHDGPGCSIIAPERTMHPRKKVQGPPPEGFLYQADVLPPDEELNIVEQIRELPLHIPFPAQGWRRMGVLLTDRRATLGLSAPRCLAHRMGAQHSRRGGASLFDHLSQPAAQALMEACARGMTHSLCRTPQPVVIISVYLPQLQDSLARAYIISRSRNDQEKPENRGAGVHPHPCFREFFQLS
jgi:hypothetical protein